MEEIVEAEGVDSAALDWDEYGWAFDGARLVVIASTFGYLSLYLWKRILGYALLPAQVVHAITYERLEQQRKQVLQNRPEEFKRITIPTLDNAAATLDGMEIVGKNRANKYILYLNPNGVCYEDTLEDLYEYSKAVNCKAVVFNYRGVGHSTHWPTSSNDLVKDGLAVLKWIERERQVSQRDILLHGHSIGGAVGILGLQSLEEHSPIIADRTFGSLLDLVVTICRSKGMIDTSVIGYATFCYIFATLGMVYRWGFEGACLATPVPYVSELCWVSSVLIGITAWRNFIPDKTWPLRAPTHWSPQRARRVAILIRGLVIVLSSCAPISMGLFLKSIGLPCTSGIIEFMFLGANIGFFVGYFGYLFVIARVFVKLIGWDMDCMTTWNSLNCPKAILYHNNDTLIPTRLNLVQCVANNSEEGLSPVSATRVIELTTPYEPAHMYPLMGMHREKAMVVQFARSALGL